MEGCGRGFDTSTRLLRHAKVHNKGGLFAHIWHISSAMFLCGSGEKMIPIHLPFVLKSVFFSFQVIFAVCLVVLKPLTNSLNWPYTLELMVCDTYSCSYFAFP